jgi:hypothetical protein
MTRDSGRTDHRINLHDEFEVGFWCNRLRCSRGELFAAVRVVGSTAADCATISTTSADTVDDPTGVWRGSSVASSDIASILHRATLAVLVGDRTFERGRQCYAEGRVLEVAVSRGELRGTIRAQDTGRAPYAVRMWVREDGIAYQCTCPIGANQQFCKHTVAIALAHLDREQPERRQKNTSLRSRLAVIDGPTLIERLVELAHDDPSLHAALLRICDESR